MRERECGDVVLMVNGQPVRILPEVDFSSNTPDKLVAKCISSIEVSVRIMDETMLRMANLIFRLGAEFAQFAAEHRRWAAGYRSRSHIERRYSRTRRKQRPTRLQRRRQRQTKNKLKR